MLKLFTLHQPLINIKSKHKRLAKYVLFLQLHKRWDIWDYLWFYDENICYLFFLFRVATILIKNTLFLLNNYCIGINTSRMQCVQKKKKIRRKICVWLLLTRIVKTLTLRKSRNINMSSWYINLTIYKRFLYWNKVFKKLTWLLAKLHSLS